jgi:hypothetical protein
LEENGGGEVKITDLATIRARCVLISRQSPDAPTVAMALTCISAIDSIRDMGESDAEILTTNILAAWKDL